MRCELRHRVRVHGLLPRRATAPPAYCGPGPGPRWLGSGAGVAVRSPAASCPGAGAVLIRGSAYGCSQRSQSTSLLTHDAAQIEDVARVLGRRQRPHLESGGRAVDDHQAPGPAVPLRGLLQYLQQPLAHLVDRRGVVQVQIDRAGHPRVAARPVLERLAGEVRHGHGDPPLVPGADAQEGEGDLLDLAPLAVHHHGVADPDHVAEGDLEPGEEIAQRGLGGHARDDADDARGGQHRGPDGPHLREGEQHRRDRDHTDDRGEHPLDQGELGPQPHGSSARRARPPSTARTRSR